MSGESQTPSIKGRGPISNFAVPCSNGTPRHLTAGEHWNADKESCYNHLEKAKILTKVTTTSTPDHDCDGTEKPNGLTQMRDDNTPSSLNDQVHTPNVCVYRASSFDQPLQSAYSKPGQYDPDQYINPPASVYTPNYAQSAGFYTTACSDQYQSPPFGATSQQDTSQHSSTFFGIPPGLGGFSANQYQHNMMSPIASNHMPHHERIAGPEHPSSSSHFQSLLASSNAYTSGAVTPYSNETPDCNDSSKCLDCSRASAQQSDIEADYQDLTWLEPYLLDPGTNEASYFGDDATSTSMAYYSADPPGPDYGACP